MAPPRKLIILFFKQIQYGSVDGSSMRQACCACAVPIATSSAAIPVIKVFFISPPARMKSTPSLIVFIAVLCILKFPSTVKTLSISVTRFIGGSFDNGGYKFNLLITYFWVEVIIVRN
jgi:hypothetical protein